MSKDDETGASKAMGILILFAAIPIDAWAAKTLWWWFAVPLGVTGIGMAHAVGLRVLVGFFLHRNREEPKDGRSMLLQAVTAVVVPLLTVGFGAIAHWLMTR